MYGRHSTAPLGNSQYGNTTQNFSDGDPKYAYGRRSVQGGMNSNGYPYDSGGTICGHTYNTNSLPRGFDLQKHQEQVHKDENKSHPSQPVRKHSSSINHKPRKPKAYNTRARSMDSALFQELMAKQAVEKEQQSSRDAESIMNRNIILENQIRQLQMQEQNSRDRIQQYKDKRRQELAASAAVPVVMSRFDDKVLISQPPVGPSVPGYRPHSIKNFPETKEEKPKMSYKQSNLTSFTPRRTTNTGSFESMTPPRSGSFSDRPSSVDEVPQWKRVPNVPKSGGKNLYTKVLIGEPLQRIILPATSAWTTPTTTVVTSSAVQSFTHSDLSPFSPVTVTQPSPLANYASSKPASATVSSAPAPVTVTKPVSSMTTVKDSAAARRATLTRQKESKDETKYDEKSVCRALDDAINTMLGLTPEPSPSKSPSASSKSPSILPTNKPPFDTKTSVSPRTRKDSGSSGHSSKEPPSLMDYLKLRDPPAAKPVERPPSLSSNKSISPMNQTMTAKEIYDNVVSPKVNLSPYDNTVSRSPYSSQSEKSHSPRKELSPLMIKSPSPLKSPTTITITSPVKSPYSPKSPFSIKTPPFPVTSPIKSVKPSFTSTVQSNINQPPTSKPCSNPSSKKIIGKITETDIKYPEERLTPVVTKKETVINRDTLNPYSKPILNKSPVARRREPKKYTTRSKSFSHFVQQHSSGSETLKEDEKSRYFSDDDSEDGIVGLAKSYEHLGLALPKDSVIIRNKMMNRQRKDSSSSDDSHTSSSLSVKGRSPRLSPRMPKKYKSKYGSAANDSSSSLTVEHAKRDK